MFREENYFKVIKRFFSLALIKDSMDKNILHLLNSDYGMFYKFIHYVGLVVLMLEQTFKPIPMDLVTTNLEFIKQFANHIANFFDIDPMSFGAMQSPLRRPIAVRNFFSPQRDCYLRPKLGRGEVEHYVGGKTFD
ncbi:MAG: hypothetical protein EOO85_05125 [Pedobacter sp.]|nr:MAG: hypothetical protein EOO85_05125 [Pedobacter sp.]